MQRIDDTFSANDGLKIFTICWQPAADPIGVILLVHGIGEHAGRYDHVAEVLTDAGYIVYALDHRGHGRSEGLRTYFESFDVLLADLENYYQAIKAKHTGVPFFMYGHSMGSLISLMFVLMHQSELAGWISTGSPLMSDSLAPKFVVQFANMVAGIAPKLQIIRLAGNNISRDPVVVERYNNDPLVNRRPLRVGMVTMIFNNAIAMRKRLNELTLPILVMHGGDDAIAPASGSEYLYIHAASEDKQLKIYDKYLHEIHNEFGRETVFADMLAWLERQNN